MNKFITLFFIIIVSSNSCVAYCPQKMIVTVPVVSLRTEPKEYTIGTEHDPVKSKNTFGRFYDRYMKALPTTHRDPLQDTQLLYNERLICLEELTEGTKGWLKVKAIEQARYNQTTKQWDYMVGYIKSDEAQVVDKFKPLNLVVCKPIAIVQPGFALSMGTKLFGTRDLHDSFKTILPNGEIALINAHDVYEIAKKIEPVEVIRKHIVACAKQLGGMDYSWGGRSSLGKINNGLACCPDCSGLTNLAYRATGLEIPRDAQPQFLKSKKIESGSLLLPADCIYIASTDSPEQVNHVFMYLGDNQIIECCIDHGVCTRDSQERLGNAIIKLNYGDRITIGTGDDAVEYLVYFRSFLNDPTILRELREYATAVYNM